MRLRTCFLCCLCLFTISLSLTAQTTKPKIIVGIVVDQMRWDYLYRYQSKYGNQGFKRLLSEGYSFDNCAIPYTPAVTAAGHTCIYTGGVPSTHGIVGNDWVDRDGGYTMYCTRDSTEQTIGSNSALGKMSPRNLLSTTIGDELRLATNFKSRVFGIALKDRGGILPAGHSANGAFWMDDSSGNWISSTYYYNALPAWVTTLNQRRGIDSFMRMNWIPILPMNAYTESTADETTYEKPIYHEKNLTFPHAYASQVGKNYYSFRQSPYGNTYSFDFAKSLILEEQLGKRGETDMLCLSLSATDYISHRFGPNSIEVEDTYLRLDRDLGAFLSFLDKQYGKNNYLVFLSADHGAPQSPAYMLDHKLPGGSLWGYNLRGELNTMLQKIFGVPNIVKVVYEYQVYLDANNKDLKGLNVQSVTDTIIGYLRAKKEVMNAFAYSNWANVILPVEFKEKLAKGYNYKRSGDIQFILKPQYTDVVNEGTEHGTMYNYDAHIPLIWFGQGITKGRTHRPVYMTDIAPTLAAMLNIQVPSASIGTPLTEIVK